MKKKSLALVLVIMMVFGALIVPQKKADAKSKCWYGKYFESAKTAKKCIKFKGNKVKLRGKWTHTVKRVVGTAKERKYKKTFKLTKKTKYYLDDASTNSKLKKISKKKFKKLVYSDVSHTYFKIRYGKVVKAVVSLN